MKRFLGTPLSEYAPALALLAVTLFYLATGYGYEADARAFPVTVAWVLIGLIGLDLVSRTRTALGLTLMRALNPAADPEKAEKHPHYALSKQWIAVAWLAGFSALLVVIGILYAVPIYVFASLRVRGKRPLLTCLITTAAATLFVYLLFVQLLAIELYPGMLFADY